MEEKEYPSAPYRIRVVEPVEKTTREQREDLIESVGLNPFLLKSKHVYIDLLTDSGTGALSQKQWAGLMEGDEAYSGSRNFYSLQDSVLDIMGFEHVIPTHQGRGAENLLFTCLLHEGDLVPNNMHFDTTKAHVENQGARAVDVALDEAYDPQKEHPFKGNVDLDKLRRLLEEKADRIPLVMTTITCNTGGGQPVSMANIRQTAEIASEYGKPFFIDACRFAENAYFIQQREEGYAGTSIAAIVKEMMSYADGCTMSGKKDALVNIGGFLAVNDDDLYRKASQWGVVYEGFPTYGGLAGRDLEAMARGLREAIEKDYLAHRVAQVRYLNDRLEEKGIPVVKPAGGHAVYIDGKTFFSHIPQSQFPSFTLSVELYIEGGVRGVEIGTVLAGRDPETGENLEPNLDLLRLAIPRRTYTYRHLDYVADAVNSVYGRRAGIKGLRFSHEPPVLRHFTARFQRVEE